MSSDEHPIFDETISEQMLKEVGLFITNAGCKRVLEHEFVIDSFFHILEQGGDNPHQNDPYYECAYNLYHKLFKNKIKANTGKEKSLIMKRIMKIHQSSLFDLKFQGSMAAFVQAQMNKKKQSNIITPENPFPGR